jgi:hypothetical protein
MYSQGRNRHKETKFRNDLELNCQFIGRMIREENKTISSVKILLNTRFMKYCIL